MTFLRSGHEKPRRYFLVLKRIMEEGLQVRALLFCKIHRVLQQTYPPCWKGKKWEGQLLTQETAHTRNRATTFVGSRISDQLRKWSVSSVNEKANVCLCSLTGPVALAPSVTMFRDISAVTEIKGMSQPGSSGTVLGAVSYLSN